MKPILLFSLLLALAACQTTGNPQPLDPPVIDCSKKPLKPHVDEGGVGGTGIKGVEGCS